MIALKGEIERSNAVRRESQGGELPFRVQVRPGSRRVAPVRQVLVLEKGLMDQVQPIAFPEGPADLAQHVGPVEIGVDPILLPVVARVEGGSVVVQEFEVVVRGQVFRREQAVPASLPAGEDGGKSPGVERTVAAGGRRGKAVRRPERPKVHRAAHRGVAQIHGRDAPVNFQRGHVRERERAQIDPAAGGFVQQNPVQKNHHLIAGRAPQGNLGKAAQPAGSADLHPGLLFQHLAEVGGAGHELLPGNHRVEGRGQFRVHVAGAPFLRTFGGHHDGVHPMGIGRLRAGRWRPGKDRQRNQDRQNGNRSVQRGKPPISDGHDLPAASWPPPGDPPRHRRFPALRPCL